MVAMRVTSFALVAAVAVSAVLSAPASFAQTCQRVVSIAPQASAGEDTGMLTFAVRSGGCAAAGEVGYLVQAGTALPGVDFQLPSGRLRWAAGDTAVQKISAVTLPDSLREADIEQFTVRLTGPSAQVQILRASAQGRILDGDGPTFLWAGDDDVCPSPLAFQPCGCEPVDYMPIEPYCPVTRFFASRPPASTATLRWSTVDGTARAGLDYVAVVDRTQSVPAGSTMTVLRVRLLARPAGTPSRSFSIKVSDVSAGALADAVATFTIDGPNSLNRTE